MLKITFSMCALALCLFAQTPANQYTGGYRNGRFWMSLDETSRTYFLTGFGEGLDAGGASDSAYFPRSTYGEIRKGIDQFYEDPANTAIPIANAMIVFTKKVNGEDPSKLATITANLRRFFKEVEERDEAKKAGAK